MTNIFTAIGIATVTVFCFMFVCLIIDFISDKIHEAMWIHKYRHRFDKPPTAACYCIDCKFHGDAKRCTNPRDYTADEWFCQAAEPKERED